MTVPSGPVPYTPKRRPRSMHAAQDLDDGRPVIDVVAGKLPEMVERAEAALLAFSPGPAIYQRGGRLVRVMRVARGGQGGLMRSAGSLAIIDVDADFLVLQLAKAACWRRYDGRSEGMKTVDPPREVATAMLAAAGLWRFPPLTAIIEAPTLRPDGGVIDRPGYDAATGLLFDPGATTFAAVPSMPTRADARAALRTIHGVLKGFPFADPGSAKAGVATASFAVALAAVLTALLRPALRTAPLFAFTAPTMGSGKSLLVDVVSMISTGRPAAVMAFSGDSDEERKRLTAVLAHGAPLVSIDNVEVPLASDALCSVLTQSTFRDRVLGSSRMIELPTCATFTATGNNLALKGDLATRALACRLDPKCENPEHRRFNVDLYEEIPKRRAELVMAALVIVRAHIAAGRPPRRAPVFGRFEDWDAMVRAPLLWLGLADPCLSRQAVARADPIGDDLRRLLRAWEGCFGARPATIADAIDQLRLEGGEAEELRAAMGVFAEKGVVNARRMGRFVARHEGRIVDGLGFREHGEARLGRLWAVERT